MAGITTSPFQVALIADLGFGTGAAGRAQAVKLAAGVCERVNRHVAAVTPLAVSDDGGVQGVYAAPHLGFEASLQLRLELLGTADVLIGLGWGSAGPGSAGPGGAEPSAGRSGAAVRRAREALAVLRKESGRARRPAGWRTYFIGDDPTLDDAFVAGLVCRDELVGRMDRRDARITLGLLRGMSQQEIGREVKIAQSAVSGRLKRNGAYAILMARERLEAIAKGEGWPGGSAIPASGTGRGPGAGGSKPGSAPGVGGGKPGSKPGVSSKPGKATK